MMLHLNQRLLSFSLTCFLATLLLGGCFGGRILCDDLLHTDLMEAGLAGITQRNVEEWFAVYDVAHPHLTLNKLYIRDYPAMNALLYHFETINNNLPAWEQYHFIFDRNGELLLLDIRKAPLRSTNRDILRCLGDPTYYEAYYDAESYYRALWYLDKDVVVTETGKNRENPGPPRFSRNDTLSYYRFSYIPPHIRQQKSLPEIASLVREAVYDYSDNSVLQEWPGRFEDIKATQRE